MSTAPVTSQVAGPDPLPDHRRDQGRAGDEPTMTSVVRRSRVWARATAVAVTAVLVAGAIALTGVSHTDAAFSDAGYGTFTVGVAENQPDDEPSYLNDPNYQGAWDGEAAHPYLPGALITYGGHVWRAKYYVGGGSVPGADGYWGAWEHVCDPPCPNPPWPTPSW